MPNDGRLAKQYLFRALFSRLGWIINAAPLLIRSI